MLTASTISRASQLSNSYSENVDLEIVDLIIERAPDATTFPEVYKAYVEVLEDNGVSPAKDAAYYQFLLKLGIVRAPTWGERWAIWRRTHAPHGLSARQPLSPQVQNTSGLADIRRRVPFLASASSDLDEAFAKSTDDGEGEEDEGSVISYLASLQRPSPRKAMGMVGYTTTASYDDSQEAPYRTSTPVFDRMGTPRPPPYSESDISEVSGSRVSYGGSEHLEEENGRLIDALSTPRGVLPALGNMSLDDAEDGDTVEEEANEYSDDSAGSIDPMLAWEMERRADEFYRTGLLGRCWDMWTQSADWIQKTSAQIDTVRSHILLRHALAQWRHAQEKLLDMPNTADAHRRHHLQFMALSRWGEALKDRDLHRREGAWEHERSRRDVGTAWVRWRELLGARRTNRFLKDISTRERDWRAERDEELLRGSLQTWHDRTRESVGTRTADERYNGRLLRDVFADWHAQAVQQRDLQQRLDQWDNSRRPQLLAEVFYGWKQAVRLGQTELGLAHMSDRRVQYRAWQIWRQKSKQYKAADRLAEHVSMRRAFGIWQSRVAHHRRNERKAMTLARQQDTKLLSDVMRTWKTAERGELLLRVRTDRLRRDVLDKWRSRSEGKVEQLEQAQTFREDHHSRIKRSAFAAWRSRLQGIQAGEEAALNARDTSAVRSAFKKWRQSSTKADGAAAAADKARAFFLQREVFRAWNIALAETRRDKWVENRRLEELRDVFHEWQLETVVSIERKRALKSVIKKRDETLLKSAMGTWTARIIEIKSRELDVKEQREYWILSDAFVLWRDRTKQVQEAQDLAQSFIDVSANQTVKRVFKYWKSEALKSRDRRTKLDQTLQDRNEALLADCFESWLDRTRERSLADVEWEVLLRQEDALMFKIWDQWVGAAKILPAVQFDNSRMKQLAWMRWRRAFELAKTAKAVKKARERELLEDVFAVWRNAAAVKVASKPKRVRGRMRAHTPEQELRSSSSSTAAQGPSKPRRSVGSPILGGRAATASPTNQEPAYSRLRSELVRPRIASRSSPVLQQDEDQQHSTSPLVRALRGALPDR